MLVRFAPIPNIDPRLASEARAVRRSNHGAVNRQISLSPEPAFIGGNPSILRMSMVADYMPCGQFLAVRETYQRCKCGEISDGHFPPLTNINSLIDKSRVLSPDQCALYLYHFAPSSRGTPPTWTTPAFAVA